MGTGYVLLLYVLGLLELHIGLYACFDLKPRGPWSQIAGGVICIFLAQLLRPTDFPVNVIASFMAMMATIFCMGKQWKNSFYRVLILAVWISGLREVLDGPGNLHQVINSLLCCLVLGLFAFVRKKISGERREKFFKKIQKRMPLMLVVVVCNMFFLTAFLGIAVEYTQEESIIRFLGILKVISFFNILLLFALVLYIWETNRTMELAQNQMEKYRRAEKAHYEMILKNEEVTKKYRHDMKNHLICMEQLAEKEAWMDLKGYLSGMTGQMQRMPMQYETGHRILDIITNYLPQQFDVNADIRIFGGVSGIGEICQEDLCTIYANLLQNALEELQRKKDGEKGFLEIHFSENQKFLQIEMENSLAGAKQNLQTQKEDKEWHGYGIGNVKDTVEKNHGAMQIDIRDNSFYVSVILPLADCDSAN